MANKIYDIDVRIKGDQQARQGLDGITEAEKRRKKAFEEANKSTNQGLQTTQGNVSKLSSIVKTAGVALVGLFAVDKIKDFTQEVFKTTATFQKFEAVLTNTLGSRSEAQKALKQINDFASSTPFSVEELTDSFIKLTNAGFKPTTAEMTKLGDLASATGKSFDQLTEAILDAQSFEFERLKEFGIKASQNGDKIAFSFKGVTTEVAKTNDAVRAYILSLGDLQGVSGGMAAISKTLEGQLSNLGDTFDQLKLAIGERLKDAFADALGVASSFLGTIKELVEIPLEQKIENERTELNALVTALINTNKNSVERSTLISEITAKYPEFLRNLDLNTASESRLKEALQNANEEYAKRSLIVSSGQVSKLFEEETNEVIKEITKRRIAIAKLQAGESKQGIFGIGGKITDKKVIKNQVDAELREIARLEVKLEQIRQKEAKAQSNLARENFKGGENLTDAQLLKELEFQKQKEKDAETISKNIADFEAKQRSKAEEDRKKDAEDRKKAEKLAEEARKKALEEQKKLLEEQAKQRAEFALRETEAQRQSLVQITQFELEELKSQLDNKKLSEAEKIKIADQIAQKELELQAYLTNQKQVQYRLDKDNKIQEVKLTATENENLLREQSNREVQIEKEKQKRITEAQKEGEQQRKEAIKGASEGILNIAKDLAKGREDIEKDAAKREKELQDERLEGIKKVYEGVTFLANAAFEFDKIQNQVKLDNLKAQQEEELKLAGNNEQNKQFIRTKFANEEKKLKEGQARADKNKALFDIAINTALAVAKAIALSPATFGLPFSAFAIAQGAIQAALVASRPIPKFKDGVEMLQGAGTETSDSILAKLSKGERVVSAETNKAYFPALSAIHNGLIAPDAINSFVKGVSINGNDAMLRNEIKGLLNKVDKLTSALENQGTHNISIDENGINHYISGKNQTEQILNKRYSF